MVYRLISIDLCAASNVGALIDSALLPIDERVVELCGRRALDPLQLALHGGEDFELLFTVKPENVARLPRRVDGVEIKRIGEITECELGRQNFGRLTHLGTQTRRLEALLSQQILTQIRAQSRNHENPASVASLRLCVRSALSSSVPCSSFATH